MEKFPPRKKLSRTHIVECTSSHSAISLEKFPGTLLVIVSVLECSINTHILQLRWKSFRGPDCGKTREAISSASGQPELESQNLLKN